MRLLALLLTILAVANPAIAGRAQCRLEVLEAFSSRCTLEDSLRLGIGDDTLEVGAGVLVRAPIVEANPYVWLAWYAAGGWYAALEVYGGGVRQAFTSGVRVFGGFAVLVGVRW